MSPLNTESERLLECPMRRVSGSGTPGCGIVDVALGWLHHMPLVECNQCWNLGHRTVDAAEWRANYVTGVQEAVARRPLGHKAEVLLTIERRNPSVIRDKDEWETAKQVEPSWAEAESSWHSASKWASNGWSFLRSYFSSWGRTRRVRPETRMIREVSCFGIPGTDVSPCPMLRGEVGERYCGACGCGKRRVALLDPPKGEFSKLDFPYLLCPLKRPGFHNSKASPSPN